MRRSAPPKPSPRLRTCINCGARKVTRKAVSVARSRGRAAVPVVADVCDACGARYYDLAAMRALEG